MKKILLVLFTVLLFFSCKKKDNLFLHNRFTGTWEFENFSGYPFTNNFLPPGNGRIIILFADGRFERRQHDTVLFRGRFFLNEQKDCYVEETRIHFSTDELTPDDSYIDIEAGKLTFSTPTCYADGGISYFRRIE